MRNTYVYWLIALVLGAALAFFLADLAGGIAGFEPTWRWASFVALAAIAIWVAPGLSAYMGRGGAMLQGLAIWLVIALVFALIYAYRHELGLQID